MKERVKEKEKENLHSYRNPNFPRDPTKVQPKANKQRTSSSFDWEPYDPTYKKYLHIGEDHLSSPNARVISEKVRMTAGGAKQL